MSNVSFSPRTPCVAHDFEDLNGHYHPCTDESHWSGMDEAAWEEYYDEFMYDSRGG